MDKWESLKKFIKSEMQDAINDSDPIIERQLRGILLRMNDLENGIEISRCYFCEKPISN